QPAGDRSPRGSRRGGAPVLGRRRGVRVRAALREAVRVSGRRTASAPRRVLIVSPHFPPDSSAATHRVRLLGPHLPDAGWPPTIVTVDPSGYEGRLDPDLASLVPPSMDVVRAPAWPAGLTRRIGLGDLGIRALAGLGRACRELLARQRYDVLF